MRYFDKPLSTPAEYNKSLLPGEDIYLQVGETSFRRLYDHVYEQMTMPGPSDKPRHIWNMLVFALIVDGGFCNSQGSKAIWMLRVGDVMPALIKQGYVWLPRLNGSIQDYVRPILGLGIFRTLCAIQEVAKFRRLRDIPACFSLIPGVANPYQPFSKKGLQKAKSSFARWLTQQVKHSGCEVQICMRHLFAYGAKRLQSYSNFVAGYLFGNHITHSVQSTQSDLLDSLRGECVPDEMTNTAASFYVKQPNRVRRFISSTFEGPRQLETIISDTLSAVRAVDSLDIPEGLKRDLKEKLTICQQSCLARIGTECKTIDEAYLALIGIDDAEATGYFNLAIQANWMKALLSERRNTFLAYSSDIRLLVGENRSLPINELSEDDIYESLDGSTEKTRCRNISAVNHFHDHLKSLTQIEVKFPFVAVEPGLTIRHAYVFTTEQVKAVIKILEIYGAQGRAAAISVLLGAFWGLRIRETVKMTVGQIDFLLADIIIHVKDTKRAPKRDVLGVEIPDWVWDYLDSYVKRIKKEGKNRASTLLLSSNSVGFSERKIRYLIEKALAELKIPGSHHFFRHYWVNRLLALGHSLDEIAILAHHWSADTTVSSYAHIAPLLQKEQLTQILQEERDAGDCDAQFIRISRLGLLRGKSDRADQPAHLSSAGYSLYSRLPEGNYIPDPNGYFVSIDDAIQYLLSKVW